jgi:pimeloyl-ACP methyl ester carboxylesterase
VRSIKSPVAVGLLALVGSLVAGSAASTAAAAGPAGQRLDTAVLIQDVVIPVNGQPTVRAYVVRPAGTARPRSLAGALYLHWFEPGQSTQNRGEYLAEAVEMAGRGVVAVLPQLTFPWQGDPVGDARDREAVTAQFEAVRRVYAFLLAQQGVHDGRTAVVGHDYGGMYGAMLSQTDPRVRTSVFMGIDATWANWFDTFWLGLPEEQKAAYRALYAGLDPVDNCTRLGAHVFFQWGDRDPFIPAETRALFAAANPAARATLYTRADHFLTQQAKDDRMAWVTAELGL